MNAGIPRVLGIEDDDSIRSLLGALLEGEGMDAISCSNRNEARKLLDSWKAGEGDPDLVLMDLFMPGDPNSVRGVLEGAASFVEEVWRYNPRIQFILMTAAAGVPKVRWAADVVTKPFDCDDLIGAIRLVLEKTR